MRENLTTCFKISAGLRKTLTRLGGIGSHMGLRLQRRTHMNSDSHMGLSLPMLLLVLLVSPVVAEPRRIIVERPDPAKPDSIMAPFQYEAGAEGAPPRLVIDPAQMIYQMKVDSINKSTEDQIKKLIEKLERKFNDPQTEEEVGKMIGEVVMRQQMALLDLQIDRALEMKDSLLLEGLELALRELLVNTPGLRTEIQRQLDALERRFEAQR